VTAGWVKVGPPHRSVVFLTAEFVVTHPYLPWLAAGLFALAIIHTFSTKFFEHLAHTHPRHAGI
jgi:hypothetical protein